jgi:hypothetical protein
MMNWRGCGKKWSWPNLRYHPDTYLEGLRKITKTSVRVVGFRAEICSVDLPNMKQEC